MSVLDYSYFGIVFDHNKLNANAAPTPAHLEQYLFVHLSTHYLCNIIWLFHNVFTNMYGALCHQVRDRF